jgi:hypothetical protein
MNVIARIQLSEKKKNKFIAKRRFKTYFDRYIQFFNQVHVYELMEWNSKTSPQPELKFSFWRTIYNISIFVQMWLVLFRHCALVYVEDEQWQIYLADSTRFVGGNRYLTLGYTINVAINGILTLSLFTIYQHIDPVTTSFWLKPMAVMDGRLKPKSIGLDQVSGNKLMKRERIANFVFVQTCGSTIICGE